MITIASITVQALCYTPYMHCSFYVHKPLTDKEAEEQRG